MGKNKCLTNNKLFDDGECPICCSTPQVDKASPPCGHVTCYQCLEKWRMSRKMKQLRATCPVCNRVFSEIARTGTKKQLTWYIERTLCFLLCSIVFVTFFPWMFLTFVMLRWYCGIFGGLLNFTGIVWAILRMRHVLIYRFLPTNHPIANIIGFAFIIQLVVVIVLIEIAIVFS